MSGKTFVRWASVMLRPQRRALTAAVALSAVGAGLAASAPLLLGRMTDLIFAGITSDQEVDFSALGRLALILLFLYVTASAVSYLGAWTAGTAVERATARLREQVTDKLDALPISWFDRQSRGEVLSRMVGDVDNLSKASHALLGQLVTPFLVALSILVATFRTSPVMALVAMVAVPVSVLAAAAVARRAQPHFAAQRAAAGRLTAHVEDAYAGHTVIRLLGLDRRFDEVFDQRNGELRRTSRKAQTVATTSPVVVEFIGHLGFILVAVVGALRVTSGALSIGELQAFIQYARQLSQPLIQLAGVSVVLQSGIASADRVFALLDEEEPNTSPRRPVEPVTALDAIAFDGVTFRYPGGRPLLENLTFAVRPGTTVAVVGPTGAGKTTLVNLLLRFYEPASGRVMLNGTDIARMTPAQLRSQVGVVLQETWLFRGTIAANIAYGHPNAGHDEVVAAARSAHLDHLIRALPQGYQTILDEDGIPLSAGEQQLVAIARAFVAQPSVLVLDEATSLVDSRTEILIRKALDQLRANRTSFVIAHRLATARDADLILVLNEGSIAERGTHDELLAAGGMYAQLYASQFEAQRPASPAGPGKADDPADVSTPTRSAR